MAAYPKSSPDAARSSASEFLTIPNIKKYIESQQEARSKRTGIDADWMLKRLAEEAEADLADIFDDGGNLKPIHQMPKIWRQGLIGGVDVIRNGDDETISKIKLSDRVKRLELIGKHVKVGAFLDRKEVTGKDGGPVEVEMSLNEQARRVLFLLSQGGDDGNCS